MNITTLRKRIKSMRDRGVRWMQICEKLHIPEPGMAFFILEGRNGQPYEPTDPKIRKQIGLPDICKECHRPQSKTKSTRRIADMSAQELQWRLEHREVVQ